MSTIPFPTAAPAGGHLVGQPFTITHCWVPINLTLTCNCGGDETTVTITGSVASACASCGKTYNAAFNPTQMKIEIQIGTPEKEPS